MRQANLAWSRKGVIRGLHYHERGQDDLFACLQGMVRVVVLNRETGETFTEDIGDENPVAIYVPGLHAHGYEALTDCSLLLPRHRGVRPRRPRRARRSRGTTRASSTSGARDRRFSRSGTRPRRPDHRRGRASSAARSPRLFPEALALDRAEWDVTLPAAGAGEPHSELVLHAAAWTNVDGAEDDPQGAAAVNVGGTQHVAELGAPLVAFSTDYVFDGTKRDAVRRVGRARTRSARTAGRSCTARRPPASRPGSSARRGSSGRPATTSSARCCGSAPSATRWRSSTTSAAARPTSATSRRRCRRSSSCRTASTTSPRPATARGPTSPRRSSRRPASTAASAGSRPPSSARRRRGRRTRCCARRRARPSCRTGATGLRECLARLLDQ